MAGPGRLGHSLRDSACWREARVVQSVYENANRPGFALRAIVAGPTPKTEMTTKRPPKGRISSLTPDLGSIFLRESVFDNFEAQFL